ncbi:MAG TPA: nitronate monooxygenase [Jatrophihabitans sp.]|nr:nitronate monooxygenase [Jatrophihabitans sp.]
MTLPSELPVVQAPMAGGPSTAELTAAVSAAGGYGFLAAGYLSAAGLSGLIAATRALTGRPFGVNLFVPSAPRDPVDVAGYAELLQPEADRLGVALGEPRWDDDDYPAKLSVLEDAGVHLVSFTFGCPSEQVVERLHRAGSQVAVTVTSTPEARLAMAAGADLLIVQGTEAGGHQGSFVEVPAGEIAANRRPLLAILAELRETAQLPMIGTGGVMSGADAARVLHAGAVAVQIGTALLCTPEAGTSAVYRDALQDPSFADTIVTRAYSGRYARGLVNRFALEHHDQAPQAYPEVHHLTRPVRAAATRAGDADVPNLWAGTGWRQLTVEPAAVIVSRIAAQARSLAR